MRILELAIKVAVVECQRPFDAADLDGDVIETNNARFLCFGYKALPRSVSINVVL
jgi:hypothetical protein